jgi:hypothetical protein
LTGWNRIECNLHSSLLLPCCCPTKQVTVYKEGQAYKLPAISNKRDVDFGPGGCFKGK